MDSPWAQNHAALLRLHRHRRLSTGQGAATASASARGGRSSGLLPQRFAKVGFLAAALSLLAPSASVAAAKSMSAVPFQLLGKSSAELLPIVQAPAMFTWLLLIFFPRWKHTKALGLIMPALHALLYAGILVWTLKYSPPMAVDFSTLPGIMAMFVQPDNVFAAWLHYLVFDPLIGLGMVLDAKSLKLPHLLLVPCLLATMFVGPIGFLLYLVIRTITFLVRKPRGVKGLLMGNSWRY